NITEFRSSTNNTNGSCLSSNDFINNITDSNSTIVTVYNSNNEPSAYVLNEKTNIKLFNNCTTQINLQSKMSLLNWKSSEMCSDFPKYLNVNQIIQPLEYLVSKDIDINNKEVVNIGNNGLLLKSDDTYFPIFTNSESCKNSRKYGESDLIKTIQSSLLDSNSIKIHEALKVFEQRIFDKNLWEMCKPKTDIMRVMCQ
ncbi:MAG: hypothetical protein KDC52_15705, partial [Ignavibacteriae bacterium]|nr:hypothetical protein [Ignavibacteriota bacterium]